MIIPIPGYDEYLAREVDRYFENENLSACPECGGRVEEGECIECSWLESNENEDDDDAD